MYKSRSIAVVVPAYNEEVLIGRVIETCPGYVDRIIIIDDCSKDGTSASVQALQGAYPAVELIRHEKNQGVGGAIATGYKRALELNMDIAVVMAGDAQMDPADMPALLDCVIDHGVDYAKGNRLVYGQSWKLIPKTRYFGNSVLSLLTKIASGYWHVADSQTGYTAISNKALALIDWDAMYKRYGQPNDVLVRLNVEGLKVRDVPIKPVYNIGEKSGIKVRKVVFTISWLLIKRFLWRLLHKYVIRDFHPLVFFYLLGFFFYLIHLVFLGRVLWLYFGLGEDFPSFSALTSFLSFITASQFTLFAMWFDMEANKDLR